VRLRRSSAHPREIPALPLTRRGFLRSLSRTALVLPLEEVLRLARPAFGLGSRQAAQSPPATGSERMAYEAPARPAPKGAASPVTGTPVGVQFSDVAKRAGLNVKTIYGGEHRNKYLLETTGCGAAFFDYDQDDWVDIFLVNGWRLEGFPKGRSRSVIFSRTTATAHLPT